MVDSALDRFLPPESESPSKVHQAMRYSVLAPGKRLRPVLTLVSAEVLGGHAEDALPAACAMELIHAFSLIHDDLPAMDDDDLRRGRPTSHVAFGEAVAILAGDALACLAFEIVARETPNPELVKSLVLELGQAVGTRGMIGGQILDLCAEGHEPDLALVREIHRRKTAALIKAACALGAISARVNADAMAAVSRYGELLGLAFQVMDDLLDEISTPEQLGKATRKDHERGKMTFPACAGIDASRRAAQTYAEEAISSIAPWDASGDLMALARYVVTRTT